MPKVKYFGTLAQITQCKEEEIKGETVKAVLIQLRKKYGRETWRKAKSGLITVNDLHADYKTKLAVSDVVCFMPVCTGG